ncbi:hypothetical protein [Gloeocapsa sp. PCC 73106]|uniref:hypothetical protein n=1 Tax=Gloeocapsa sp. PCC 73106 TaxID=102232 RepID=UPI0002AC8A84|nr:hypothetical protein [Gloeocapsa sp. PCC 73106]ELR97210.1 hypothetical protein GLO73106DRAFT_00010160 [Gloeocapsa sp. PCC 73106]
MNYPGYSLRLWLLQEIARLVPLPTETISLYLLKYHPSIIYRSRVLSQLTQDDPGAIAFALVHGWNYPNVEIELTANFALDFKVGDRLVALWLEKVYHSTLNNFSVFSSSSVFKILPQFFPLQYSHARCCAWLRQLHQQGVITNNGSIPSLEPYAVALIELLPCLNPKDKDLLLSLVAFCDSSPENLLSSSNNLALAVLNFERYEGIWRNKPNLIGVRALLLILAQSNLQYLLETQLLVGAPREL